MTLKVGSLFSGIGGLDLGLERAGMKIVWHSEIDEYASKVLKKHWPEVPNHGDIKRIDFRNVEPVDVICGGYPCQPFSLAGVRKGTDDPRHLWPWVRDAISVLRPKFAILENVRGHLSLGGTTVIGELAEIGYNAEWRLVSASGMGAPHRRDRIIIVAYPEDLFSDGGDNNAGVSMESEKISESGDNGRSFNMANVRSVGRPRWWSPFSGDNEEIREHAIRSSEYWKVEPDVGRMADGIPHRLDRLRGLGNAVVPQIGEYIGRLITNG